MTPEIVMNIGRQAIEVTLMLSGPLLLSTLVIGLIVSIFQAATQINEVTLVFIPKMFVTGLVLWFTGDWLFQQLVQFYGEIGHALSSAAQGGP